MNNLLFILGIIALSNGNISLYDNKFNDIDGNNESVYARAKQVKKPNRIKLKGKLRPNEHDNDDSYEDEDKLSSLEHISESDTFNIHDINRGIKMLDLSDDDLDRGLEIITRTKKYMNIDERKVLVKIESMLDLVRGIKKLNTIDEIDDIDESDFFRSMEDEDRKNMMIKEILEVFPENKKETVEKAIDMKKKIELFAELFLPDDIGEEDGSGFSLSSLANINNLGSLNNLKLWGSFFRSDNKDLKNKKNNKSIYNPVYNNKYEEIEEDELEYEYAGLENNEERCDIDYYDDDYIRINK